MEQLWEGTYPIWQCLVRHEAQGLRKCLSPRIGTELSPIRVSCEAHGRRRMPSSKRKDLRVSHRFLCGTGADWPSLVQYAKEEILAAIRVRRTAWETEYVLSPWLEKRRRIVSR